MKSVAAEGNDIADNQRHRSPLLQIAKFQHRVAIFKGLDTLIRQLYTRELRH